MKIGFYVFKLFNDIAYVTGERSKRNGFWLCVFTEEISSWVEEGNLTPLPYFRDTSSPTIEELNMLQMVDEKCYNEVVKILSYLNK